MVLKILLSQGLSIAISIHFHKFDGSHLVFSRWPKVNNVRPLDNMKIKFEVDWGNGSKEIAFTKVVHSIHF